MDYEGYTFVFFIQKINNIFSLKCDIIICIMLLHRRKIFLKCKFPIFALNMNKMKISILFIKSKKAKTEKKCVMDRLKMAYI